MIIKVDQNDDLNLDEHLQNKLLTDYICKHFDEVDDLFRFIQNRNGKIN